MPKRSRLMTLAVLIAGGMSAARATSVAPTDRAAAEGRAGLAVEVVKPVRRSLRRELKIPGVVRADEQTDLFAKASGYVKAVNVDIGARVRRGEALVELDVPEMMDELRRAEALVDAARARLAALDAEVVQAQRQIDIARHQADQAAAHATLSQLTLDRKGELYKGKAIPVQAYDEARITRDAERAGAEAAQAMVEKAKSSQELAQAQRAVGASEIVVVQANLAKLKTLMRYATIRAPFDGVITQRHVDIGAFVRSAVEGASAPLLHIDKVDRVRLLLDIPETEVASVGVGTAVEVRFDALGGAMIRGVIARTAFALNGASRAMRAQLDLDNADGRLQPGMYGRASVKVASGELAWVIPSRALRVRGADTYVLVVRHGVAHAVNVTIGYDNGVMSEVVKGLTGDESVVTQATSAVADGAEVTPIPAGSQDTASQP